MGFSTNEFILDITYSIVSNTQYIFILYNLVPTIDFFQIQKIS